MLDKKQINNLKVVFMGTSELSESILDSLLQEKYNLIGVFTKPDMKIGRKQESFSPAVKILAEKNNVPVFQPLKFKTEGLEKLQQLAPDIVVVAAYGKILPREALIIPHFGCVNVHVSLLPKYRGASPVQNAILNGEKETGVTIMLMDEKVDNGDILFQEKTIIAPEDNTKTLMKKLSLQASRVLLETIPLWISGNLKAQPQDDSQATFCQIINRQDGKIDWNDTAENIYNKYRAFSPWPGIFSYLKNDSAIIRLKLNKINIAKNIFPDSFKENEPGKIIIWENEICVQTIDGLIILQEVQKEGKKNTDIKSFLNGHPNFVGSSLKQ